MTVFTALCDLGPADGLRVAVKDSIDIAGLKTSLGSAACVEAAPATQSAEVVDNILQAGHRVVCKVTMHELAFGMTGVNHYAGTPLNVQYPNLIPGGSSSGSACIVASGDADFSLGTDTGGSVRVPAACCGTFGFKPTFGRVSRKGVWPATTSLDSLGPFAATLPMLEVAERAIDPSFNLIEGSDSGARFGLVTGSSVRPAISDALDRFLQASGVEWGPSQLPMMEDAFQAGMAIINAETVEASKELLATGKVGQDVAERLHAAAQTTEKDVLQAEKVREAFCQQVDDQLGSFDVLVMPALPDYPLERRAALAGAADLRISALVRPFNLSGHPCLVIPFEVESCPVGIQLVGRRGADEKVFLAARELLRHTAS